MYSTMDPSFSLFFFSSHDIGVGGGVLLSWPEFFMFVDPRLILSTDHTSMLLWLMLS